jgi:hypothetical protein
MSLSTHTDLRNPPDIRIYIFLGLQRGYTEMGQPYMEA